MSHFRSLAFPCVFAALLATGCKSSQSADCKYECPCPASFSGPGWCNTTGPGPCCCQESNLCPGWCLADAGDNTPVRCDAGAGNTGDATPE